jgi:hypothetical protein
MLNHAIWVTCDHDDVEVRINLLGGFIQTVGRGIRRYLAVSFTVSRLGAFRKSGARVAAMPLLDCPADRAMATVTSGLAMPPVRVCDCRWVADQIETTTEPGASRKGFAGAHESTAAWKC